MTNKPETPRTGIISDAECSAWLRSKFGTENASDATNDSMAIAWDAKVNSATDPAATSGVLLALNSNYYFTAEIQYSRVS